MEDDDDLPKTEMVDLGEADDEDVIDTPDGYVLTTFLFVIST
jgi:hypothetical protein